MIVQGYLNIKSTGVCRFTKNKVGLDWNEIAVKLEIDIPNELFKKPILEARIEVGKDIVPKPQPYELILNTKELIEQSTGAQINFKVLPYDEEKND